MEVEREAGESPARSRHCEGELSCNTIVTSMYILGRRSLGNDPKSGNLLVLTF